MIDDALVDYVKKKYRYPFPAGELKKKNPYNLQIKQLAIQYGLKKSEVVCRIHCNLPLDKDVTCVCGSGRKAYLVGNSTDGYRYDNQSCRVCAAKKWTKTRKDNNIDKIKEFVNPEKFRIIEANALNSAPSLFECVACGHVQSRWLKNGRLANLASMRCEKCEPSSLSSYEFELVDLIEKLGFEPVQTFPLENTRTKHGVKTIDVYIPEKQLGIEINGVYWHSDLYKGPNDHLIKTREAKEAGINLLQITDIDWLRSREICESMIKAKLGCLDRRVYARKCILSELSARDYRAFCEANHIQGYAPASVRYGLHDETGSLVAAIGFSKSRYFKDDETFELVRYCTSLDTSVVGGFSRLLKQFDHNVISYCNLSYSDGNVYEKTGFEFVRTTKPNYWYFNRNKMCLYSRQKFQKHMLPKRKEEGLLSNLDMNLTEGENMSNNGYLKYYDCGNKVYLKRKGGK